VKVDVNNYFLSENDELYIQLQEWLKNNPFDEEEAKRNSIVGNPGMLGLKHTEDTKKLISEKIKGTKVGEDNPMKRDWVKEKHKQSQNRESTRLLRSKNKTGNTNVRGKSWFNNGEITKMLFEPLDDSWKPGRLNPHWNHKRGNVNEKEI
jgi:hypothetical protein